MRYTLRTVLAASVAAAAFLAGAAYDVGAASNPAPPAPAPSWTSRPCPTEDSVNCVWNATTRGNGRGHSFIVREVPGRAHMVCVFYVGRHYARTHDYCTATR